MLVTIALSSLIKALNKLDLPTFGFPIIAVFTPSFKIRLFSASETILSKVSTQLFNNGETN